MNRGEDKGDEPICDKTSPSVVCEIHAVDCVRCTSGRERSTKGETRDVLAVPGCRNWATRQLPSTTANTRPSQYHPLLPKRLSERA